MVLSIFPSLPGQSESVQPDGSSTYIVPFLKPDKSPFSIALHGEIKYLAVVREGAFYYSRVLGIEIVGQAGKLYYAFHLSDNKHLVKGSSISSKGNPDFLYTRLSQLE
jgi:hypothetical protein